MAAVAENGIGSGDQFARRRESDYRRDVRELVEMLSNLNPSAKEFVPSSGRKPDGRLSADAPVFDYPNNNKIVNGGGKDSSSDGSSNNQQPRRRRNSYYQGRRRSTERLTKAQKEERIRRTVYVSDIDHTVTEEMLASLFSNCGNVVDCRVCGDPNSVLRFAFIEFADEYGARAALNLGGYMLGFYPLRVLPSKTAIQPVNKSFLPQSAAEEEMCTRTVYCTNIDKKVTEKDVKDFFETICGEVFRLRLLGDNVHTTRIAFIEFSEADGANAALNCSGAVLGSLPIRVSPSKTPVRARDPRAGSP